MPRRPRDDNGLVVVPPALPTGLATRAEPSLVSATTPGTYGLSVYRGDTMDWVFRLMSRPWTASPGPGQPPETSDGAGVDITGWRFRAEIRSGIDGTLWGSLQRMPSVDPEIDPSTDEGRDALEAELAGGWLRMRLTPDQSRLVEGAGRWDLEATTPDGWVKTVLEGPVTLAGDITTAEVRYGPGVY